MIIIINLQHIFKIMKKPMKKPGSQLIVDEYEKMMKGKDVHTYNSPYQTDFRQHSSKAKMQEVQCRHCKKLIPEINIVYHQKICGHQKGDCEDYYQMLYSRPHNNQSKHQKQFQSRNGIKKQHIKESNDDYYPRQQSKVVPLNKSSENKTKRPLSAMNKKIQLKIKPEPKMQCLPSKGKLKKASSSTRLNQSSKKSRQISKEKNEKNNKQSTKLQKNTFKNPMQKKHPLSISSNINNSKLKKKSINPMLATKFMKIQERSLGQRSLKRPESRSKRQQRQYKNQHPFQAQKKETKAQKVQQIRNQNHQTATQRMRDITTNQLRQMVRQRMKDNKSKQQILRRRQSQHQEREPNIEQPRQQRVPGSQQRQRIEGENSERMANLRSTRNQNRQQNGQRNQRRINQQSRNNARGGRSVNPGNILNLVSRTLNDQMEMINNQFSVMTNIFENFSNFVNINIQSQQPHFIRFSTYDLNSSDSDFDSNSTPSDSSYYDINVDVNSQNEGMDDQQLNCIPNKRYKVQQKGQNQCTICLVELKTGDIYKQLFCDHVFHSECIQQWLRRKSACPVCRDQLGPS